MLQLTYNTFLTLYTNITSIIVKFSNLQICYKWTYNWFFCRGLLSFVSVNSSLQRQQQSSLCIGGLYTCNSVMHFRNFRKVSVKQSTQILEIIDKVKYKEVVIDIVSMWRSIALDFLHMIHLFIFHPMLCLNGFNKFFYSIATCRTHFL